MSDIVPPWPSRPKHAVSASTFFYDRDVAAPAQAPPSRVGLLGIDTAFSARTISRFWTARRIDLRAAPRALAYPRMFMPTDDLPLNYAAPPPTMPAVKGPLLQTR